MPSVFLSPSTQEYNEYYESGTEEYYMNLIADAMEPYLRASGISFGRNDPALTVGGSVNLSNAGDYDAHLAIHSNAAPEALSGQIQGTDVYYYDGSTQGQALAQLIAANLATVYPYPELVGITPNRQLYELRNTEAPTALVEVAYHDNPEDAAWIRNNVDAIARALALALTQYLGVPFVLPDTVLRGVINPGGPAVNLRQSPSFQAQSLAVIPSGGQVLITGESGGWYVVNYNGRTGYVAKEFITLTD